MNDYPEVAAKIARDYLDRVKSQLRLVPAPEQEELLRELQSHLYEAYQQTSGEDDVVRMLAVLRNLGEPHEVVSDRLPETMVRSGARRNLPLYVLSGMVIALFGIPLGFGGVAVLSGILVSLAGVVLAYYAALGTLLLTGAVFMALGLMRIYRPEWWDKLVSLGVIQMSGRLADFLDQLSPSGQGLLMILFAAVFIATGLGMLRIGTYLIEGLRFLFRLAFDGLRQLAQGLRRKLRWDRCEVLPMSEAFRREA